MSRSLALAVALVLGGILLMACGAVTTGSDGSTSGPPGGTAPRSPGQESHPDPATSTAVPERTLTGTVSAGVEKGCLVLTSDGTAYVLVGELTGVRPGSRVTVRGHETANVATTCQQGPPFQVTAVVTATVGSDPAT